MKYNIQYSPKAEGDLDEIWNYISSELCNPRAAQNTINRILDRVDQLGDFPQLGAALSSVIDVESEYRFLVCGNYIVFYRIFEQDVYVDRVLYGKRNYLRILFQELTREPMDD